MYMIVPGTLNVYMLNTEKFLLFRLTSEWTVSEILLSNVGFASHDTTAEKTDILPKNCVYPITETINIKLPNAVKIVAIASRNPVEEKSRIFKLKPIFFKCKLFDNLN